MSNSTSVSVAHNSTILDLSLDILAQVATYLQQEQIEALLWSFNRVMQAKLVAPHVVRVGYFKELSYAPGPTSYFFQLMKNLERVTISQLTPIEQHKLDSIISYSYLTHLELHASLDPTSMPSHLQLRVPDTSSQMPNLGALFEKCPLETLILHDQGYFTYQEKWVAPYHLLVALFIDRLPKKLQRFKLVFSDGTSYIGMSNLAFSRFPPSLTDLELTSDDERRADHEPYPTALSLLPNSLLSLRLTTTLCEPYTLPSSMPSLKDKDSPVLDYPFRDSELEPSVMPTILPNLTSLTLHKVYPGFFNPGFTFSPHLEALQVDTMGIHNSKGKANTHLHTALSGLSPSLRSLKLDICSRKPDDNAGWLESIQHLRFLTKLELSPPFLITGPDFAFIMAHFPILNHLELSHRIRGHVFRDFSQISFSIHTLIMPESALTYGAFSLNMLPSGLRKLNAGQIDIKVLDLLQKHAPNLDISVEIPVSWNMPMCEDGAEEITAKTLTKLFSDRFPRLSAPFRFDRQNVVDPHPYRCVRKIDLQEGFATYRSRSSSTSILQSPFSLFPISTEYISACSALTVLKLHGSEYDLNYHPLPPTLTELDLGSHQSADLNGVLPPNLKIWRAPHADSLTLRSLVLPDSLTVLDMVRATMAPVLARMSFPRGLKFFAFNPSIWTDSDLNDLIHRIPALSTVHCTKPLRYTGNLLSNRPESIEKGLSATKELLSHPSPSRTVTLELEVAEVLI